jgi:hypothetical protein
VVASWNGLAVTALAEHGALTGPRVVAAAIELAEVLASRHLVDGRLRRVSRDGVVGEPAGVLEDYGCVAEAFCTVHQLTGDGRGSDGRGAARRGAGPLRHRRGRLLRHRRRRRDAGHPARRPDRQRHAVGLSAICAGLVAFAALSGETRTARRRRGARDGRAADRGHPRFAGYSRPVAEAALAGPYEIADRHPPMRPATRSSRPRTGTRRPARSWSRASRIGRACRCWPIAP